MSAGSPGWECTRCGRKIPGTIRSCRCGARRGPASPGPGLAFLQDRKKIAGAPAGVALVLVAAGWLLRGGPAPTPPVEAPAIEVLPVSEPNAPAGAPSSARTLEEVLEEVIPSVVSIASSEGRGSGFFVDSETIVTNYHVVGGDDYVEVKLAGGEVVSGRVEEVSPDWDLALVGAQIMGSEIKGLTTVSSEEVRVGQDVLVIGSPLGVLEGSVTRGIVSALRSTEEITLIQIDAPINPGNSGGPVIDRHGRVIGIATMKAERGESIGFAVAAQHARALIDGDAPRPVSSRSPAGTDRTSMPQNLEDMNEQQLVSALEGILQHYDGFFQDVFLAASRCSHLASRLRGLDGDAQRFELGEIILDYADQRRIYSRDRDRADLPSWSDMRCIEGVEGSIVYAFEGVMVYDQVYDEYLSRRASRGQSPAVKRHLPDV